MKMMYPKLDASFTVQENIIFLVSGLINKRSIIKTIVFKWLKVLLVIDVVLPIHILFHYDIETKLGIRGR